MTESDALMRAIVENPDEDTPRLVFADWLDENADALPTPAVERARAAFIRSDIEASRMDAFDPRRVRWERIEKPRREGERWARAVLPRLRAGLTFTRDPLFRLGFPWSVQFAPSVSAIPPGPPVLAFPFERVRYDGSGFFGLEQLRASPWRSRLTAIEFERGNTSSIGVQRLFTLDGLDRLDSLAFRREAINAPEARDLLRSPLFPRLKALTITGAPVGMMLASAFAQVGPGQLRELHLSDCRLSPAMLGGILGAVASGRIEALTAGGDRIGAPEKFRVLAREVLPPLRRLDMSDDSPKETGLEAFLASPLPSALQELQLAGCNLNSDRTRLLAGGAFGNLRALNLSRNPVGNEGLAALARSPHLSGLLSLELGYSQVGDEGVLALLESPLADGLAYLDITGSPASEETKELLVGRMGDRVRV